MRTKLWLVIGVVIVTIMGTLPVPQAVAEDDVVPTLLPSVSVGVYDKYLGTRSGTLFDERTSIQSSINIDSKYGFFANLWNNKSIGKEKDGCDGNEIDYTIGWSGDTPWFSIESALVYYDCAPLIGKNQAGNIWAPYITLSKEFKNITPYTRLEVGIPDSGSDFEGGMLLSVGFENEIALQDNCSLSSDIFVTYDDGMYGGEPNEIFVYNGSMKIVQGKWTITAPGFLLTCPLENEDEGRKTETCFSISASLEF